MVIDAADKTSVRLGADFTRIYNLLKYKVPDRVKGNNIIKPVTILIMKDGDVDIGPRHS
jgi:transcriptional regulator